MQSDCAVAAAAAAQSLSTPSHSLWRLVIVIASCDKRERNPSSKGRLRRCRRLTKRANLTESKLNSDPIRKQSRLLSLSLSLLSLGVLIEYTKTTADYCIP